MDPKDQNPYAPPSLESSRHSLAKSNREGDDGLRREGRLLVASRKATFPDRCVKCNAEAHGYRLKRNLYWHHPAYFLILVICNIFAYALVAIFVKRTALFRVGLCPLHRRRRRTAILFGWFCILLSFGLIAAAVEWEAWSLAIASGACALFGIVYGGIRSQVITAKKIDKRTVWIRGAGVAFLESLDEENRARLKEP